MAEVLRCVSSPLDTTSQDRADLEEVRGVQSNHLPL